MQEQFIVRRKLTNAFRFNSRSNYQAAWDRLDAAAGRLLEMRGETGRWFGAIVGLTAEIGRSGPGPERGEFLIRVVYVVFERYSVDTDVDQPENIDTLWDNPGAEWVSGPDDATDVAGA